MRRVFISWSWWWRWQWRWRPLNNSVFSVSKIMSSFTFLINFITKLKIWRAKKDINAWNRPLHVTAMPYIFMDSSVYFFSRSFQVFVNRFTMRTLACTCSPEGNSKWNIHQNRFRGKITNGNNFGSVRVCMDASAHALVNEQIKKINLHLVIIKNASR